VRAAEPKKRESTRGAAAKPSNGGTGHRVGEGWRKREGAEGQGRGVFSTVCVWVRN